MERQVPCPRCGAAVYVTDAQCLSCGLELDEGQSAELRPAPPPPVAEVAPPEAASAAPPLELLLAVLAAGAGAVWVLSQEVGWLRGILASGHEMGLLMALMVLAMMALSLAVPVLSIFATVGRGWARHALMPVLILHAVALALPLVEGEERVGVSLTLIAALFLLVVLFLPRTRVYCAR